MNLEEVKKELEGKEKEAILAMAKEADIHKLSFMMMALFDNMSKEINEFLAGKKVAGLRARKASLILQQLMGMFRKQSGAYEKTMGKKAVANKPAKM